MDVGGKKQATDNSLSNLVQIQIKTLICRVLVKV